MSRRAADELPVRPSVAASGLVPEPDLQMLDQFGLPHAGNDAYT